MRTGRAPARGIGRRAAHGRPPAGAPRRPRRRPGLDLPTRPGGREDRVLVRRRRDRRPDRLRSRQPLRVRGAGLRVRARSVKATVFAPPLPDGGTIGVAALASPYENRSEIFRGVEWWAAQGYRVKLGDHVLARDAYVAGAPEGRAADLNAHFADPEVDVVQALQGGYGSTQAIPHVDFDLVAANPKAFIGYSDITAMHTALRQHAGLATFYGVGLVGVGDKETTSFTKDRLLAVLRGETTGPVPPDPDDPYVRPLRGGKVTAPLVGGCLWLLLQTMGTPWEIDLDDSI
ncbi:MAG: LD-carboxypeptidase, partial [Actinobacteria bacterium]